MNKGLGRVLLAAAVAVLAVSLTGCVSSTAGGANTGWTVVATSPDAVYAVLSSGTVVSLDPADGTENWRYPVKTERASGIGALFSREDADAPKALGATFGDPVVWGDTVLAASLDDVLHAFDRRNGSPVWQLELGGGVIGGLAVGDGVAYLGTDESLLYAVDLSTQEFVWAEPIQTGGWVWGAPVLDGERIYVGTMGQRVFALDKATGAQAWVFETTAAIPGGVTVAGGVVYFGTVDRLVYAVDAATGRQIWERSVGHWVMGQPLVLDDTVYVADLEGHVYALNIADGTDRWAPVSVMRPVRAGPQALHGSIVVATESGELWQLSAADGDRVRLFPNVGEIAQDTGFGAVLSAPVVDGDQIVLGTAQGYVIALDASEAGGDERWTYSAAD